MMMQRSHFEDTLLAQFIASYLENDADCLEHEDAPDKRQQQLLLDHHGNRADGAAQGERAHVAHENLRRVGVVPEKADAGADHGAAEDGDFADHRHALQFEIIGEDGIAAHVGKHGERRRSDDGATDGQPIQPVGEVHRVAGADDDQGDEDDERQVRRARSDGESSPAHGWRDRGESA